MGRKGKPKKVVVANQQDDCARLRVIVGTISGESIEFDLAADRPTFAIKKRIAKEWNIPSAAQVLLYDIEIVDDTELISKYCGEDGASTQFMMTVSDKSIHADLLDSSRPVARIVALEALVQLSSYKPLQMDLYSSSICACLQSNETKVQIAAVEALGNIFHDGDAGIVDSLTNCLGHVNPEVQVAAAGHLGRLSSKGDAAVIDELVKLLRRLDLRSKVRSSAVAALRQICHEHDSKVIESLVETFSDSSGDVKIDIARALSQLSAKGDSRVVNLFVRCLISPEVPGLAVFLAVENCLLNLLPENVSCKLINVNFNTRIVVENAGSDECNGLYTAEHQISMNDAVVFEKAGGYECICWFPATRDAPARWCITADLIKCPRYFVECTDKHSIPSNNWYTFCLPRQDGKPGFAPMPRLRIAYADDKILSKRPVVCSNVDENDDWELASIRLQAFAALAEQFPTCAHALNDDSILLPRVQVVVEELYRLFPKFLQN